MLYCVEATVGVLFRFIVTWLLELFVAQSSRPE